MGIAYLSEGECMQCPHGWFTEGFDTPDLKDAKTLLEELDGKGTIVPGKRRKKRSGRNGETGKRRTRAKVGAARPTIHILLTANCLSLIAHKICSATCTSKTSP